MLCPYSRELILLRTLRVYPKWPSTPDPFSQVWEKGYFFGQVLRKYVERSSKSWQCSASSTRSHCVKFFKKRRRDLRGVRADGYVQAFCCTSLPGSIVERNFKLSMSLHLTD